MDVTPILDAVLKALNIAVLWTQLRDRRRKKKGTTGAGSVPGKTRATLHHRRLLSASRFAPPCTR